MYQRTLNELPFQVDQKMGSSPVHRLGLPDTHRWVARHPPFGLPGLPDTHRLGCRTPTVSPLVARHPPFHRLGLVARHPPFHRLGSPDTHRFTVWGWLPDTHRFTVWGGLPDTHRLGLPDTHRLGCQRLPDTHRLARGNSNRRQSLGVWVSGTLEFGCLEPSSRIARHLVPKQA
jgi:hypothetical protein